MESDRFRRLWARQDVQARDGTPIRLHHPQVGELTVHCEKLTISGAPGQTLVVYHAQPGTGSAERLTLLAALAEPTGRASLGDPDEDLTEVSTYD